jgi:hypothetical protein
MLPFIALPCSAYDKFPDEPSLADVQAAKKAREIQVKKNKAEIAPYLRDIQSSTDAESFAKTCDKFSLWLLGKGRSGKGELPAGLLPIPIRDALRASYSSLPTKPYRCEKTRTNNGICMLPGPLATDSYKAALDVLRGGTRSKGALISDGVSTADSESF